MKPEKPNISNLSEDTGPGEAVVKTKDEILSRKYILKNKTIGISISESDNLSELGYGVVHLKDAMIEIARYILALGGKTAYGGDMRQGGFTELMFDLLAYYKSDNESPPNERFFSFLAWPLSLSLTPDKEASLIHNVSFKKVLPPNEINVDLSKFIEPNTAENLYVWSLTLTKMRQEMNALCNARIFIGGRNTGFKSAIPGILEELLIAIESRQPIYLIGALGGVTKDVLSALDANTSSTFSVDHYLSKNDYKTFYDLYNERQPKHKIDYNGIFERLQKLGFSGLAKLNGLSEEDNRRLAVTPHINEIVYLILKGLTKK